MSEEKNTETKQKKPHVVNIVVFVVFGCVILGFCVAGGDKKKDKEKTPVSISADAPLKDRIEFYAKANNKYNMKDLSVSVGVNGIITLRVLTDGLSDDHLVQRSCSYALDVGKAIFDNCAEVQRIQYLFDVSFLDSLGNENKQKAVSFALDRSVYSRIDYDNFKNMVMADYNSMWSAVEEVYIHPTIRGNFKKLK